MKKFNYILFFHKLKISIFMITTKYLSLMYTTLFNLSINLLLYLPNTFYKFLNTELTIHNSDLDSESDSESDSDLDSESDSISNQNLNTFPLDTNNCIELYKKIIHNCNKNTFIHRYKLYKNNSTNIFDNNYIFSLLNNIKLQKSYYILYAEVLSLSYDGLSYYYQKEDITKKLKIIYTFHNTFNTTLFNHYFNNPEYLIIVYYSFYTNTTNYKIFNLEKNKDITTDKDLMFGQIKL